MQYLFINNLINSYDEFLVYIRSDILFVSGLWGVLLDDKTKLATTSRSLLTEENYNALFDVIVHE